MQMGQSRRLVVLGLLCVFLAVTAGCDGSSAEPKHTFTPTATFSDPRGSGSPAPSTPSVAATGPNLRPGEKPPTLPAGAKVNSVSGALTFAMYWMQAVDWGYATTDSSLARSLYAPSCTGCARFMRNIFDATRDHHQHFRGGRISILETNLMPDDGHAGATAVVDVTIQQSALKVLNAADVVIESTPQTDTDVFRTWVRWAGSSWVVVDWKRAVVK